MRRRVQVRSGTEGLVDIAAGPQRYLPLVGLSGRGLAATVVAHSFGRLASRVVHVLVLAIVHLSAAGYYPAAAVETGEAHLHA